MATRKTRLNTDSPTPNSGSESTSSTPTTAVAKRLTRKMFDAKSADEATAAQASAPSIAATVESIKKTIKSEQISPTRKRTLTKTSSKDDLTVSQGSSQDDAKSTDKIVTAVEVIKATPKRGRRPAIEKRIVLKTPRGRKSLPVVLQKDIIIKRRNSTGRLDASDRKQSARLNKEKILRSGRPRKSTIAVVSPEKVVRVIRKRGRPPSDKHEETTEAEDMDEDDISSTQPPKLIKQESVDDAMTTPASDMDSDSCRRSNSNASSNMDMPLHLLKVKEEPKEEDDEEEDEDEESEPISADESPIDDKINDFISEDVIKPVDAPDTVDDNDLKPNEEQEVSDIDEPVSSADPTIDSETKPTLSDSAPANVSTRPKRTLVRNKSGSPLVATVAPSVIAHDPKESETLVELPTLVLDKSEKVIGDTSINDNKSEPTVPTDEDAVLISKEKDAELESPVADIPSTKTDVASPVETDDYVDEGNNATSPLPPVDDVVADNPSTTSPPKTPSTKSPSPVPASEGVSPISVKAFYGQPDFLENNPGIENDPKLRAIVKEHATIGKDIEIDQEHDNNLSDNEAEIANDEHLCLDDSIVEEALHDTSAVVIKEEVKSESPISTTQSDTEDITEHPAIKPEEQPMHVDEPLPEPEDKENILKSAQSLPSPSRAPLAESSNETKDIPESPETMRQKENHFLKLGLLTHQAAVAAKIEKQKRRESMMSNSSKSGKKTSAEYTGTLKTIIKLNRPSTGGDSKGKKPGRQAGALKMTLHKGRRKSSATASSSAAGSSGTEAGTAVADDDTYYTIQNEAGENADGVAVHGGQSRKTHNRSHTIDGTVGAADAIDSTAAKEAELLVIPEKASSFRIHPDKLCQDQCFYCGGKFGLFDTPCHVAGIKSLERQKKILANEEKLTVDNCLCDACFRHVDRRANCPMYKKRTTNVVSAASEYSKMFKNSMETAGGPSRTSGDEDAAADAGDLQLAVPDPPAATQRAVAMCQVAECQTASSHSIRRKWFMKMRRQIGKLLTLNPEAGTVSGMLSICVQHYNVIGHLMVCTLCKRKLVRNHIYYINQDVAKLEQLLTEQGVPVTIGTSPVVCKLCRYFSNLLLKPPEKPQKTAFVKEYRRRLLQFHNVDVMDDTDESQPPSDSNPPKSKQPEHDDQPPAKKQRVTKRTRKSTPTEDSISIPSSIESGTQDDHDHESTSPRSAVSEPNQDASSITAKILADYEQSQSISISEANQDSSSITAKILAEYEQSQSISIVPRSKAATSVPSHLLPKAQVILVDTGDTQHTKEDLSALRANPNISMRELFPGEEEMGLQISVPFGAVGGQRTPEGWTKCQTTIQYDETTRNLWEELQKPYGNQSSFMRHLILLEKYFRNGDLVLSSSAGCSAVNYAESVQNRLQSFDSKIDSEPNINTASISMLANSLFGANNHANSSISITPTGPKAKPKPSVPEEASTSLLKSKRNSNDNKSKEKTNPFGPPELISINTSSKQASPTGQYSNTVQNLSTSNISPSHSTSSSPTNLTVPSKAGKQSSLLLQQNNPTLTSVSSRKQSASTSKSTETNKHAESAANQSTIRLPDALTSAERAESKMWRPTLMPVSAGPPALNGQLYQTADGRILPNLVQVQSGGNPYLISIHDYNRMCILRRERLLRDQMMQRHQQQPAAGSSSSSAPHQSASSSTNHSTMMHQTSTPKSSSSSKSSTGLRSASNPSYPSSGKVQIPNKILEQNSLIPLNNAGSSKGVSTLDSLLKVRKPNPTSLLKPHINTGSKSGGHSMANPSSASSSANSNVVSITSTPSIAAILGVGSPPSTMQQQQQFLQNQMLQTQQLIKQQFLQQQMAYQQMTSPYGPGAGKQITPNVTATLAPSGTWPAEQNKSHQTDKNAAGSAVDSLSRLYSWSANARMGGMPSGSGGSMDASLLSKIPKSLTVIPQQKDRRSFSGKPGDEHSAAHN